VPKNSDSFVSRMLGRFGLEVRSSLENPSTPLSYPAEWLLDIFNGGRTDSGLRVSEMTALQVSAVKACVDIIANGVASLPLHVFQKGLEDNRVSKTLAPNHNMYDLLANEPNPEMTSSTWRKTLQCHMLLWGNGYSEIQRDDNNKIIALWPRNPSRTRPVRLTATVNIEGTVYPRGTMMYETYETLGDSRIADMDSSNEEYGTRRLILSEDMIHIPGLSLDGRLGQDIVSNSRNAIGLALAMEKYGSKFFGNGAIPAGILSVPGDMTDVQWEILKRSWAESHGGENTHKTGILPPGVVYTKTGATPNEGQFLESREFMRGEIAAIFGVPPHMIGVVKGSGGKSSVEQSSIEFVMYCLNPWLEAWKQELKRKLFTKVGQGANKYVAGFDVRRLMYPDAASRGEYYAQGRQWGFLSANDIRELEDMNPVLDGSGDMMWMPINEQAADVVSHLAQETHKALKSGTLAATPPGMTPVGNHPVNQDKIKAQKALLDSKTKIAAASAKTAALNRPQLPGATGAPAASKAKPKPSKKAAAKSKRSAVLTFNPMFRDAVGRAAFRSKPTVEDYTKIFAPVLMVMGASMGGRLNVSAYTANLFTRSAEWSKDATDSAKLDMISHYECRAAVDAMTSDEDKPAYIMRHGTTPMNEDDRYREWTDVDLDDEGRAVVAKAAELLKGKGIKLIISCRLQRAASTAEIVSEALGVPIEWDDDLATWKHGFGGKTKAEAQGDVHHLIQNPDEAAPNGESLNTFVARNQATLDEGMDRNDAEGPILFVTSGSNITSWNKGEEVADDEEAALSAKSELEPGGFAEIDPDDHSLTVLFNGDDEAKPSGS
jgi:HK97 family phage portal protein